MNEPDGRHAERYRRSKNEGARWSTRAPRSDAGWKTCRQRRRFWRRVITPCDGIAHMNRHVRSNLNRLGEKSHPEPPRTYVDGCAAHLPVRCNQSVAESVATPTFPRCCEPHGVTIDASPHIFADIGRTRRNVCFPPEPRTLLTVHTAIVLPHRVRRLFWGLEQSSPVRPRPFCTFATSVRDHLVLSSGGRRGLVCFWSTWRETRGCGVSGGDAL